MQRNDISRTLLVRVSKSDYASDRYAHLSVWHRAEEGDAAEWGILYPFMHPAAHFAMSAQCGGNFTPDGAPMWYAWRIGFIAESGSGEAVCFEHAARNVKACGPYIRRIRDRMAKGGANWERHPATAILIAAHALGCASITLRTADSATYLRYSLDIAGDALVRAIASLEEYCLHNRRAA